MSPVDVKCTWPLHRLASMLKDAHSKAKESWKESPLSPVTSMKDVSPENRDEVVAWIAQLNVRFNFYPETFFLTVSVLDRFLTSVKAQPKYLKCIAISCFYLSSKITEEEDVIPCTGELVENSGCGCRVRDILRMERIILDKLSWEINSSTAWHYLHTFQVLAFYHYTDLYTLTPAHRLLSVLTIDLTRALCHYQVARFPNAVISLAVLSYLLQSLPDSSASWAAVIGHLQALAQVETSAFMECRNVLGNVLQLKCTDAKVLHAISRARPSSAVDGAFISSKGHRLVAPQLVVSAGAVKRKRASPELPAKLDAARKLESTHDWPPPPARCDPPVEKMEVSEPVGRDYDSDATLTASEDDGEREDEDFEMPLSEDSGVRPLTYAEIVKSGITAVAQDHRGTDPPRATVTTFTKRCRLQATFNADTSVLVGMVDRLAPSMQG